MKKSIPLPFRSVAVSLALIAFVFAVLPEYVAAQKASSFNPKVVIKRPFPAIVNPKFVSAARGMKTLSDRELVLGVEINGESKAYPINMLTGPRREIINDELGGKAIAATW